VYVAEGVSATLQITGSGGSTATFQWYEKGPQDSSYKKVGTGIWQYVTSTSLTEGVYSYYCEVTGSTQIPQAPYKSDTVTVIVSKVYFSAPPKNFTDTAVDANGATYFTGTKTLVVTNAGSLGAVTAVGSGGGTVTYQWYSNTSLSNTGGVSLGTTNGGDTATLALPNTLLVGKYYYYCVATNTVSGNVVGTVTSDPVTVIVKN